MKIIKHETAVGYSLRGMAYGRRLDTGKYVIQFNIAEGARSTILYKSTRKPLIRSLYVLLFFAFPFIMVGMAAFLIVFAGAILISFYHDCLFRKSFIADKQTEVSGWISLVLSLIGLGTIVYLIWSWL